MFGSPFGNPFTLGMSTPAPTTVDEVSRICPICGIVDSPVEVLGTHREHKLPLVSCPSCDRLFLRLLTVGDITPERFRLDTKFYEAGEEDEGKVEP